MNAGPESELDEERHQRDRRRLRQFAFHLLGYFVVMLIIVPMNVMMSPENLWFVLPMVGWGGVLAIHVAWVMGLLDVLFK